VFTDNTGPRQLKFFVRAAADPNPLQFRESTLTVEARALSITAGDVNGDGRADFVLVPAMSGGVDVLESN